MKKVVIGIIIAIVIIALGAGAYFMLNSDKQKDADNTNQNVLASNNERKVVKEENTTNNSENEISNNEEKENEESENTSTGGKTLVVYYSAQSHTKTVSEKIAYKLDADIFEIVPEDVYTSDDLDWTDRNSRVSKEHDDESLRDIKLEKDTVDNWDEYDTVLIGYPIWWGIAAWPVDTFVKENNFEGKTIIPFCTSSSSGLGQSGKLLEDEANGGNWQEGHRFNSNPSDSDIKNWTDSLK